MGFNVANTEGKPVHADSDISAMIRATDVVDKWNDQSSYEIIPRIFWEIASNPKIESEVNPKGKPLYALLRQEPAILLGSDTTTVPPGIILERTVNQYTTDLDNKLKELPRSPGHHISQIVEVAAWAYYCFTKIHPFSDGNGRVGRMIVKHTLKHARVRDILFNDPRWYAPNNRERHLEHIEALERTTKTNDLRHVEVYFLEMLLHSYPPQNGEREIREEIIKTLAQKKYEIANSTGPKGKENIWPWFANLPDKAFGTF